MTLASESYVSSSRYLGAKIPGSITYATPNVLRHYCRKFTAPRGNITAVGIYVKQTVANVWSALQAAVYDDDGGEPGKLIGAYYGDIGPNQFLLNTTAQVPRWIDFPGVAEIAVPGDYWAMVWIQASNDITYATDATAGAGTGNSGYQTASGNWLIEKGATGYTWTATANVENIIRVLHRS